MKFFSFAAILVALLFSAILIDGILRGTNTEEQKHIIIEAPQAVVSNTLLDINNYEQWNTFSRTKKISSHTSTRLVDYKIGQKIIRINEKFSVSPDKNHFQFTPVDSLPNSFITSFRNTIALKSLPDGTTQVSWQTQYAVSTIIGSLINRFLVQPALKKTLLKNLQSLKSFIER